MRTIVLGLTTLAILGATARADEPTPHATGMLIEARYSPESDTTQLPVTGSYLVLGFQERRIAFGGVLGLNRASVSEQLTANTNTETAVTLGIMVRGTFFTTGDGTTDLIGEGTGTVTDIYDGVTNGMPPSQPTPFRIELGIGVQHWIVPQLALGATILGRYTSTTSGNQDLTQQSLGGSVFLLGVL